MSNVLIAYPNRSDSPTCTGGFWTSGLPLSYLQTRQLAQVARAISTDKRNTWFYLTTTAAIACAFAAIPGHNLSTAAQWRLRGFAADPRAAVDGVMTGGTLPSGWSLARSSNGTYWGSDGLLKTANSNVARFEYVSGKCALLMECAATNSIYSARNTAGGGWTLVSMTQALVGTGIDGAANTASRLTGAGTNGTATHTGISGVFSVYLRRVSGSGTITITGNNFTSSTTCTLTTNWQRFSVAVTGTVGIKIATSGDVIEMDYAQLEAGTIPTSPILTTSGSVTRQADSLTYSGASAAGANLAAGAIVVEGQLLSAPPSATSSMVNLGGAYGANSVGLEMTTGGIIQGYLYSSSAAQVSGVASSAISVGATFRAAMSWAANDVRASFNAGAVSSDTTATMPTGTPSAAGADGGACYYLTRLKVFAATKTNAQLQNLSGADLEMPPDYDSALMNAWPSAYVSGTTAEQRAGMRFASPFLLGSTQTFQYWRIDLVDESNAAGYLQLGRVFMSDSIQPAINMDYGASIGYESRDIIVETDSGSEYGVRRPSPRVSAFTLQHASEAEAMGTHLELQRQLGTFNEAFFCWDPSDTLQLPRRSYLCRLRKASPLSLPEPSLWTTSYEAKELI